MRTTLMDLEIDNRVANFLQNTIDLSDSWGRVELCRPTCIQFDSVSHSIHSWKIAHNVDS